MQVHVHACAYKSRRVLSLYLVSRCEWLLASSYQQYVHVHVPFQENVGECAFSASGAVITFMWPFLMCSIPP